MFYNGRIQNYDDLPICGYLCLIVLKKLSKGEIYEEILKQLPLYNFYNLKPSLNK